MKQGFSILVVILAGTLMVACGEPSETGRPAAVAMTDDALGHYCQMALSEHPGPKAQVHLEDLPAPLFFSQVRDAIAYQRMPEQSYPIRAIYVSDMSKAPSWEKPGVDNWAPADEVFFVVGSKAKGGMGAQELVPFAKRDAAEEFASQNGGRVQMLGDVPDSAVLGPVELTLNTDDLTPGGRAVAPHRSDVSKSEGQP